MIYSWFLCSFSLAIICLHYTPEMTRTKPWNVRPEDLPDDLPEKPVYDYADVEKTKTCGLKFKTRPHRLLLWANAHKREYPTAKWERQTVDTVTMRTGNHNKEFGSLVVKFHMIG